MKILIAAALILFASPAFARGVQIESGQAQAGRVWSVSKTKQPDRWRVTIEKISAGIPLGTKYFSIKTAHKPDFHFFQSVVFFIKKDGVQIIKVKE